MLSREKEEKKVRESQMVDRERNNNYGAIVRHNQYIINSTADNDFGKKYMNKSNGKIGILRWKLRGMIR